MRLLHWIYLLAACDAVTEQNNISVRAMVDPNTEFTNVSKLLPEAMGEPGRRTFRILVDSGSSSAVIWLEKEQLFQLALGIQQLLESFSGSESIEGVSIEEREAPPMTRLEFQVGKLALGQESMTEHIIIDAHDVELEEAAGPTLRIWGEKSKLKVFVEEAVRVCAAGRPRCPLCGGIADANVHRCPKVNGHGVHDLTNF